MNILVTGGASGLGKAITEKLASKPENKVYFTYAHSAETARQMEAELKNVKALHCDFSNTDSLDKFLPAIQEMDLDVLVNNAYTHIHKEHFYKSDPQVFINGFMQNIIPVIRITQEAIKVFRKKKAGKIISIASAANINKPPAGWSDYAACKAYLLSMSKSWATENIRFNISSNCISPAFMETPLTADTDERVVEEMRNNHPLKKLLSPDEVAEAVLFLSGASAQINGINMIMNSGSDII